MIEIENLDETPLLVLTSVGVLGNEVPPTVKAQLGFGGNPVLGFGIAVACCWDHDDDAERRWILAELDGAARVAASIEHCAERLGLGPALRAAVDQHRARYRRDETEIRDALGLPPE